MAISNTVNMDKKSRRKTRWIKERSMSGSTLKIIAIVTMLIDHVGASILEPHILKDVMMLSYDDMTTFLSNDLQLAIWYTINCILRLTGRIAFPIFCFLLIEGFLHTKNVKKYAMRLLIFSILSEIPFDLAFNGSILEFTYQNVFFTLFIGLWVLIGLKKHEGSDVKSQVIQLLIAIVGMAAAYFLKTDYSSFGIFYIVILYYFRDNKVIRNVIGCVSIIWEVTGPLAFIPINMYNGKRGMNMKYIFYIFYPAHLLLLSFIAYYYF